MKAYVTVAIKYRMNSLQVTKLTKTLPNVELGSDVFTVLLDDGSNLRSALVRKEAARQVCQMTGRDVFVGRFWIKNS
jgi:hypothetical protein